MARRKQQTVEEHLAPMATSMNIDRISSLPDSLLLHILSFLPITTAVTTSILSRRWRHVWEYLQVFDFDFNCSFFDHCESPKRFVHFVNRVLMLRRLRDIHKFSLTYDMNYFRDDAPTWIRTAAGPLLQELNISVSVPHSMSSNGLYLPQCIFTCASLVSLTLGGGIDYCKLSSVHLPSLKNLEVDIFYSNPMEMVLSGCPVLETLRLKSELWGEPSLFRSPSLRSLTIEDESRQQINNLEIHTPSLEYIDINLTSMYYQFSVSNLHNVVEAHLNLQADFMPDLLKALRRTKLLVLKVTTTEWLLRAPVLDFLEFSCLLNLQLDMPYFDSRFLVGLLCKCHMLQSLIIHSSEGKPRERPQYHEPSSLTQPTTVPTCVMSHLEIFKFGGYQHFADEHAFVVYILEKGLVLKTMTIHCNASMDLEKKHDIFEGLSKISWASDMCQLEFD